jgi:heptaprenyl diphosphate synthase
MLAGADEGVAEILTRYGERIGVAFQLSDDLLDVVGETGLSGKTPGTDLREGVATLPALLLSRTSDPASERLRSLLSGPIEDDDEVEEALALLRAHPVLDQARDVLRGWADDALAAIAPLPPGSAKSALVALTEFVVARTG